MAKIAISLPDAVLQEIENERLAGGESRSEFFRRAVEAYFKNKREKEAIEQYVRGYLRDPETGDDLGWLEEATQAVLRAIGEKVAAASEFQPVNIAGEPLSSTVLHERR